MRTSIALFACLFVMTLAACGSDDPGVPQCQVTCPSHSYCADDLASCVCLDGYVEEDGACVAVVEDSDDSDASETSEETEDGNESDAESGTDGDDAGEDGEESEASA